MKFNLKRKEKCHGIKICKSLTIADIILWVLPNKSMVKFWEKRWGPWHSLRGVIVMAEMLSLKVSSGILTLTLWNYCFFISSVV